MSTTSGLYRAWAWTVLKNKSAILKATHSLPICGSLFTIRIQWRKSYCHLARVSSCTVLTYGALAKSPILSISEVSPVQLVLRRWACTMHLRKTLSKLTCQLCLFWHACGSSAQVVLCSKLSHYVVVCRVCMYQITTGQRFHQPFRFWLNLVAWPYVNATSPSSQTAFCTCPSLRGYVSPAASLHFTWVTAY